MKSTLIESIGRSRAGLAFFLLTWGMSTQAVGSVPSVLVQYREVARSYGADGLVEATRQSTVSAQISGRVREINFDVGDHVKKGQVIVRIDEREALQSVASSQAQIAQSQASLQNDKAIYERSKQLFAQKFISQAALDKAEADYKIALAQAAVSQAGASQAALAKGYTSVAAPFSGVVAARRVELGEMVTVGMPLMTGFDPDAMRVVVDVPQDRLKDIGARPEAMIEIASLNKWIRAASVTVLPLADVRTHSTQVRINLPDDIVGVYPGMFVRAHFVVGKIKSLVIPASAVLRRSEVVAVYVVDENGNMKLRQVRLGASTAENMVEVLAGLNQGENIALNPVQAGMLEAKQQ